MTRIWSPASWPTVTDRLSTALVSGSTTQTIGWLFPSSITAREGSDTSEALAKSPIRMTTLAVMPGSTTTSSDRSNRKVASKVRVVGSAVVASSFNRAGKDSSGRAVTTTFGWMRSFTSSMSLREGRLPARSRSGIDTLISSSESSSKISTGSLACTLAKSSTSLRDITPSKGARRMVSSRAFRLILTSAAATSTWAWASFRSWSDTALVWCAWAIRAR